MSRGKTRIAKVAEDRRATKRKQSSEMRINRSEKEREKKQLL